MQFFSLLKGIYLSLHLHTEIQIYIHVKANLYSEVTFETKKGDILIHMKFSMTEQKNCVLLIQVTA